MTMESTVVLTACPSRVAALPVEKYLRGSGNPGMICWALIDCDCPSSRPTPFVHPPRQIVRTMMNAVCVSVAPRSNVMTTPSRLAERGRLGLEGGAQPPHRALDALD